MEDGIYKRLDRFMFSSSLVFELERHRVWAHPFDIFDHFPIFLEWNTREGPHNYPFKFNRSWLLDPNFTQMVKRVWPNLLHSAVDDDMGLLSHKLRLLKSEVKSWIKHKVTDMEKESHSLDDEIRSLLSSSSSGILAHEDQSTLNMLRSKKRTY